MSHVSIHDPQFDLDRFRSTVAAWSAEGAKCAIIEWQTGPGPTVAWHPQGERSLAELWAYKVPASAYNEQYADFLEYRLMPLLIQVAKGGGLIPKVMCVDQQPVVVQRQRRRELERAADSSGIAVAH